MVTQGKTKLVAIVDDDDLMRSALRGLLKSAGMPAQEFSSAEEFLRSGAQKETACLIADIRMPGMSGLELQAQLNAERCRIPTIFITAHECECRLCEQGHRSSCQSLSTMRPCCKLFKQLLRVEPITSVHACPGGLYGNFATVRIRMWQPGLERT
jgi:CheY-like chemotaxis protein